jgi:hypothetical protein
MKKTYHGSCHCGAVRFECDLDLAAGTSKCNCSICAKTRYWKAVVRADAFRLEQGADVLSDYQFSGATGAGIHHSFCRRCGVKVFGTGSLAQLGGRFYAVNVACLDDATEQELAEAPVIFQDGRHDNWQRAPAETRYL